MAKSRIVGMVRKIDELGRVTLPAEMRRQLNLNEGDGVEIMLDGDRFIVKPYSAEGTCALCGNPADGRAIGKPICLNCALGVNAMLLERLTKGIALPVDKMVPEDR